MDAHDQSLPPLPSLGKPVYTACNGQVKLAPDTPRALYRGEWVFFCLHMCKEDFDRNPATSCLAARLLVDK